MVRRPPSRDLDRATDAALGASRALVAISARSVAALDDVTLPQYRALVVLASVGPSSSGDLAAQLSVHPSTVTRLVDRLVAKRLVARSTPADRREVTVTIAPAGVAALEAVSAVRRAELRRVMRAIPPDQRAEVVAAFEAFRDAAGELPEDEWSTVLSPLGSPAD
jgi:DNA-binding MarR family transcriptional regulator